MQNIVLIGMPGCGKSTLGKLLAEEYSRKFVDADAEVEKAAGISIPELFATRGEAAFRSLESQVLEQLGKESGLVIATGGGCVTRQENYPSLSRNSRILWIKRDLAQLDRTGRPLSQANALEELYRVRKPLYERFADMAVENLGSIEETLEAIRRIL